MNKSLLTVILSISSCFLYGQCSVDATVLENFVVSGDFVSINSNSNPIDDDVAIIEYNQSNYNFKLYLTEYDNTDHNSDLVASFDLFSLLGFSVDISSFELIKAVKGKFSSFSDPTNGTALKEDIMLIGADHQKTVFIILDNNGEGVFQMRIHHIQDSYFRDLYADRIVSGNFMDDVDRDAIAFFYSTSTFNTKIHVFSSQNSSMTLEGVQGKWSSTGYSSEKINGRIVSGDFNRDGISDIAGLYDYGAGESRFHVFLGKPNGSGFYYPSEFGWWGSTGYFANQTTGRIVTGDFDFSSQNSMSKKYKDDIAVVYDYGATAMRIHVFTSTGADFNYNGDGGFYSVPVGYDSQMLSNKIVSFSSRNKRASKKGYSADLFGVYNYGSTTPIFHQWINDVNDSEFNYSHQPFGCSMMIGISDTVDNVIKFESDTNLSRSVSGLETTSRWIVYPNPFSQSLKIKKDRNATSESNFIEVSIINLQGQIVFKEKFSSQYAIISAKDLIPGNYILKLIEGENIEIHRILKL